MGDTIAFVSNTGIYKDRTAQLNLITKRYPKIKRENIWGQGRKKFQSCRDIRYLLKNALRTGDTFVITHLFQISTRRDVILDTIEKFHAANVQLMILDIGYFDRCAENPPKSGHFAFYTRVLNAYAKRQKALDEQKEEERLKAITRNEKPKKAKRGNPGKQFEDYDPDIRNAVTFYVQMLGTINEKTQEEVLEELQKRHEISMPTLRRIVKKYREYLERTHKVK